MRKPKPIPKMNGFHIERFWEKVEKAPGDACWLWQAALKPPEGYGVFKLAGKMFYAHRIVWALSRHEEPGARVVCHTCDNPSCVRPEHLFIGTMADNIRDRDNKGRQASGKRNGSYTKPERRRRGEGHGMAKLNEDNVREIRKRYAAGGISQQSLADEFGVTQVQISWIVLRKSWSHID